MGPRAIRRNAVIILFTFFVIMLCQNFCNGLPTPFSNRRPTIQKVQTTGRFVVYLKTPAIVVSLDIRLDPTALTVTGEALAFAVGFALRDLVASFIADATIIFDRPFQVGGRDHPRGMPDRPLCLSSEANPSFGYGSAVHSQ